MMQQRYKLDVWVTEVASTAPTLASVTSFLVGNALAPCWLASNASLNAFGMRRACELASACTPAHHHQATLVPMRVQGTDVSEVAQTNVTTWADQQPWLRGLFWFDASRGETGNLANSSLMGSAGQKLPLGSLYCGSTASG